MNVNVSEKTEQKLKEIAAEKGQDVAELAGILLAEYVAEKTNGGNAPDSNGNSATDEMPKERRFMRMKGMFSGGDGNSAERVKEIILAEIDKVEGLSKR